MEIDFGVVNKIDEKLIMDVSCARVLHKWINKYIRAMFERNSSRLFIDAKNTVVCVCFFFHPENHVGFVC